VQVITGVVDRRMKVRRSVCTFGEIRVCVGT